MIYFILLWLGCGFLFTFICRLILISIHWINVACDHLTKPNCAAMRQDMCELTLGGIVCLFIGSLLGGLMGMFMMIMVFVWLLYYAEYVGMWDIIASMPWDRAVCNICFWRKKNGV